MTTFEVRRLEVTGRKTFPVSQADAIGRGILEKLHRYGISRMKGYNHEAVRVDRFMMDEQGGTLDGEAITDDYGNRGIRYLCFLPDGVPVSFVDPEIGRHNSYGHGNSGLAFVSSFNFQAYDPVDISLHEVGHAWFYLKHHKEEDEFKAPLCVMSVNIDPSFCDECTSSAKKIEEKWASGRF